MCVVCDHPKVTSITCENSLDFLVKNEEKFENNLPACCVVVSISDEVFLEIGDGGVLLTIIMCK